MKRWEDTLLDLLKPQKTYAELLSRARQVRPVRTNPASYESGDLDLPLTGEFHD